jgi:hypothetical protein
LVKRERGQEFEERERESYQRSREIQRERSRLFERVSKGLIGNKRGLSSVIDAEENNLGLLGSEADELKNTPEPIDESHVLPE